jgi:chromosome segregation ATPase
MANEKKLTGQEVYDKIKAAVAKAEKEHEAFTNSVYSFETKISGLSKKREGVINKLALIYLPELSGKIGSDLGEAEQDVRQVFRAKQDKRKELEANISETVTERNGLNKRLGDITEILESKVEEREELKDKSSQILGKNETYVKLTTDARAIEAELKKHQPRLQELKEEAQKKLPAYHANKRFTYLLQRKYGTEAYSANKLVRFFDSLVAKGINYENQLANFMRLKERPGKAEEQVKSEEEEYQKLLIQIQEIESKVYTDTGLVKVMREGEELLQKRNEVQSAIQNLNTRNQEYAAKLKALDNTKDEYHQRAVDKLEEYLGGETIAELRDKAGKTLSTEDDSLVDQLDAVQKEIQSLKTEAKTSITARDKSQESLGLLTAFKSQYSEKDYESARSRFNYFDVDSLIADLVSERQTSTQIWNEFDSHHYFERPKPAPVYTPSYTPTVSVPRRSTSDYDSGRSSHKSSSSSWGSGSSGWGSSHKSSSSSWGSGGFGGGGFKSGGGFGGGGFKSGKGF